MLDGSTTVSCYKVFQWTKQCEIHIGVVRIQVSLDVIWCNWMSSPCNFKDISDVML